MQRRALTINFQRSVSGGVPQLMEVAVAPLSVPSAPHFDATLVGGTQTQSVLLSQDNNPVIFYLVPTDHPDLTERVPYRVAWREKYMGRQFSTDIVMPDFDVAFDDLGDLGNIIGGESYVQWSDRGRPGGVAGLDDAGQVIDGDGYPLTGRQDAAIVQGRLDAEVVARQQGDAFLRSYFLQVAADEVSQVLTVMNNKVAQAIDTAANGDVIERAARQHADAVLADDLHDMGAYHQSLVDGVNETLASHTATLEVKADLVDGKVPTSQIPAIALNRTVSVASQAQMLALTNADVQPGDIAVRPDGSWFLNYAPPSILENWTQLTSAADVESVNGQRGVVVLGAADVGARSSSALVPLADVDGLTAALGGKTDTSTTSALTSRVSAIESDTTIVHTTGGAIPHAVQGTDVVFVDVDGLLVRKDGTRLTMSGGGGPIGIGDVIGLQPSLTSLETRIELVEEGEGGGGVSPAKSVTFNYSAPTSDLSLVTVRSPLGINAQGNPYYDPAGAAPGEEAFAYVSPNGHLKLVKRNEGNPPDPVYALNSDLSALSSTVAAKANQSALNTTNATVATKANQSAVDSLTTTVNGKASQAALDSLTTTLNGKADSSALATATGRIGALETTMPTKADLAGGRLATNQIPTSIPQSSITNLSATLAAKADLSGGVLAATQIPAIPQNKVTNLSTTLAAKADLVDGKLATSQLPTLATVETYAVANRTAMLALTPTQAQVGDQCIITTGVDTGTYTLISSDPSQFASWLKHQVPSGTVTSVNGQSGVVVLAAADVGARSLASSVPMGEIDGLGNALAAKVDTSTYTTGLAGKTAPADVQNILTGSTFIKQLAGLVATGAIASRAGQQSIDGVLAPIGTVVLLTAQASSVDNGLWIVAAGSWTRPTDFAAGSYLVRGTLVLVSGGATNADTIWQMTANSGVVGTNGSNWASVGNIAPPPVTTASLGVQKVGNDFRAQVVSGGGINAVAGGLQLDPNIATRKWAGDVPAGSAVATLTHNLNTLDVNVAFRNKATGDAVLVGWRPASVNTVSVEFDSAPAAGEYRAVVTG